VREARASRPDVAALRQVYREAMFVNTLDTLDDRLIGAILMHALDADGAGGRSLERRTVRLAPGEPLIRQGTQPRAGAAGG
jgi:hypothetical protein